MSFGGGGWRLSVGGFLIAAFVANATERRANVDAALTALVDDAATALAAASAILAIAAEAVADLRVTCSIRTGGRFGGELAVRAQTFSGTARMRVA